MQLDVGDGGFQPFGGEVAGALQHLLGGARDGDAAHLRGTAAAGAAAGRHHVAVALDEAHPVVGDAEAGMQHLGEGGLVALAMAEGADMDQRLALGRDATRAHSIGWPPLASMK
jgi:hypothetical protein